jgi:hypothetical protein
MIKTSLQVIEEGVESQKDTAEKKKEDVHGKVDEDDAKY